MGVGVRASENRCLSSKAARGTKTAPPIGVSVPLLLRPQHLAVEADKVELVDREHDMADAEQRADQQVPGHAALSSPTGWTRGGAPT